MKPSGYLKLTGAPYGKNSPSVITNESGAREFNQETIMPSSVIPIQAPAGSHLSSQSHLVESYVGALRRDKFLEKLPLRRNPESAVYASSHSDQGVTFSRVPEKPTVDGFNWRKYGQKLVRGNVFVRSYFKCSFHNCPARKQVQHSHDGNITEINYLWKHEHPETSPGPDASETHLLATVASNENFLEVAVSQSSEIENAVDNISPDSKRQKKESAYFNDGVLRTKNYDPRVVVESISPVDFVHDGYRWRKYGEKQVKGKRNPRNYYRCTNVGCPVKKHVERSSHDEKVVVTTYEGQHDHNMPVGRPASINTQGNNHGTTTSADAHESIHQTDANTPTPTGLEIVVHIGTS